DDRLSVAQVVWVEAAELTGRPGLRENRLEPLGTRQEEVSADLVDARRHRIPLIGSSRQGLHHEFVPDGGRAHDAARVVIQRRVVGIAYPYGRRQAWRKADRPVVLECLGGPGLGGDMPSGEGQVAMAAELQAPV